MLETLAMTALSGGLSFMSGIGSQQASAKQGRLQQMEDARAFIANTQRQEELNAARAALGERLLKEEEKTVTTTADNSWQNTAQWSDVDITGFMAAGEKAGFNPVTWLNSGALSLFARSNALTTNGGDVTQTQTRTGHNAADAYKIMMPDMVMEQASQIPKPVSTMEVLGNAGNAALSTYKDLYKLDKSQQFQTSLLDRQLAAMAQARGGGGIVPGTGGLISYGPSASAGGVTGGGGTLSNKGVSANPYPASWERGKVEVTNPSGKWKVDKTVSDAETAETRYGDLMQEVFGISNILQDGVTTLTGKNLRDWGRAAGMNIGDYKSIKDWYNSSVKAPLTITVRPKAN